MRILILFLALFASGIVKAQSTIGVTQYDNPNVEGYILFSGISSTQTYLVDKCGRKINQWGSSYKPGLSVYLLPNGDLFRTGLAVSSSFGSGGGKGGVLEKYNWNGSLLWTYIISDTNQCQHHDAMVLPNGNILAIAWERKTSAEALQAGKNPAVTALLNNQEVWTEKVIELQPLGTDSANIVWEWKAWDHLVQDFDDTKNNFDTVNQHPELLNVNYVTQGPPSNSDWLHINSIDYDSLNNQILLSSHSFEEFWIIDHSTTTAEAAGHSGGNAGRGGDLLYRWGNPITYGRGVSGDHKLFKQHHASYIKPGYPNAGKVLVFNNGVNRPGGNHTTVDIVDITQAGSPFTIGDTTPYLPTTTFWSYSAVIPNSFYATNIGGVYPITDGSFLITDGPQGEFVEIDSTSTIKWRYTNPVNNTGPMTQGTTPALNSVFRAAFYSPTYSAFSGLSLTPGTEIEINPANPPLCSLATDLDEINEETFSFYPNPTNGSRNMVIDFYAKENYTAELFNALGERIISRDIIKYTRNTTLDLPDLEKGIYFLRCNSLSNYISRIIIVN